MLHVHGLRALSVAGALASLLLIDCSLGVSPGSYQSGGSALPGAPGPRVFVFAGSRDVPGPTGPTAVQTNDVWSAPLLGNGKIGTWGIERAGAIRGEFAPRLLAPWVFGFGYSAELDDLAVEWATFDNGVTGEWQRAKVPGSPSYAGATTAGGTMIITAGGLQSSTATSPTTYLDTVTVASFNLQTGVATEFVPTASKLSTPRVDAALLVNAGFIYAIGGHDGDGGLATVDFATIDATSGNVGPFIATESLFESTLGKPFAVNWPEVLVHAGRVYVVGGRLVSDAPSDIVLTSKINPDGSLAPWQTLTKLPTPVMFCGLVADDSYLYVLGGSGTTSRSDQIFSAKFLPDGTLAPSWDPQGHLPAPRDGVGAMVTGLVSAAK